MKRYIVLDSTMILRCCSSNSSSSFSVVPQPFQAFTAFTIPRHPRPAGIAFGFLTFSFFFRFGVVNPTPNPQPGGPGLCIYIPRDRVAQLYPWTLGSSGTSGLSFPVPTYVTP
jgi:hypothetical protein